MFEGVYQYIQYYNTRRIHTVLKMPPAVFAQKFHDNKVLEKLLRKLGS
jgi:hypothetical protein